MARTTNGGSSLNGETNANRWEVTFSVPDRLELATGESLVRTFTIVNPVQPTSWLSSVVVTEHGTFDPDDPDTWPTFKESPDPVTLVAPFTVKCVIGYGTTQFDPAEGVPSIYAEFYDWQQRLESGLIKMK